MTYSYSLGSDLSQGDILSRVKLIVNVNDPENNGPKYGSSHVIVLSRNCEIDKPIKFSSGTNSVLVARVIRLALAPPNSRGYIKENRVLNAFFLPGDNDYIDDCYIDWRTLQPTGKGNLLALRSQSEYYKCTLKKQVLEDCFESLFIFLTKPED